MSAFHPEGGIGAGREKFLPALFIHGLAGKIQIPLRAKLAVEGAWLCSPGSDLSKISGNQTADNACTVTDRTLFWIGRPGGVWGGGLPSMVPPASRRVNRR